MKLGPSFVYKHSISLLGVFVLWSAFYTVMLQEVLGMAWNEAMIQSLGFNAILGIVTLVATSGLRYYNPITDRIIYLILSAGFIAVAVVLLDKYVLATIQSSAKSSLHSDGIMYLNAGFAFVINLSVLTLAMQRNMLAEDSELQQRKEDTDRIAKDAELDKLRHQLQPHFLFNSLNSINALILSKPEQARKMVQQLSAFLRGTIRSDDKKEILFSEELEHINLYLEIEKVRFGHRLQTEITISESCYGLSVPPLLLQPLLENAIKFGLYGTTDDVLIAMNVHCDVDYLEIQISNPTDDEVSTQAGTGFGLTSINRRLNLLFGRNDLLHTTKTDKRFTVNLKIPQQS